MNSKTKSKFEARAKILKAIAHASRLFIIEELGKGERCVNELTDMIGVDTSTVSKHLSVLKNAGLVLDEKRGSSIYYNLRMPCILDFFECVEAVMEANAKEQMEIVSCCSKV
ncbi:MAG: metalloregulator ArsR/SmtB family transcription factor [Spirochaetota bacterium]|nr:metalloregulator ArsR/SmtB family transcription factor [Spirochaetota bacterium]